ncbi:MAG: cyclic nucleotide-binding domain-containing protein [Acidobacteriota bacterium]
MPSEVTMHYEILEAIESLEAIRDIKSFHDGHYKYELDLEVTVYGRNYNGKKVGPYVRLLDYEPNEIVVRQGDWGGNTFYIVVQGRVEVFIEANQEVKRVAELGVGAQFGEMSILAGVPRNATIKAHAEESARLLEVQRPALRLLRKLSKFGESLDKTYRSHGRDNTLNILGLKDRLNKDLSSELVKATQFKVLAKNHVLCRESEVMDRLILIKEGWVSRTMNTEKRNTAPIVTDSNGDSNGNGNGTSEGFIDFVGPGYCFGSEGIKERANWPYTVTVLGRTEVLEIELNKLRKNPALGDLILQELGPYQMPGTPAEPAPEHRVALPAKLAQDKILNTGLADATNLLVMDMDLCVRCGNCSLACHEIHGQSRLLRRGIHVLRPKAPVRNHIDQSLLAPEVCLHCKDPECLTGCPTGAIGRFQAGEVDINPATCIGCGDCATQCPYNAITMIPRKSPATAAPTRWQQIFKLESDPMPSRVERADDLVAVKCNLCNNTTLNPKGAKGHAYSCVENCPTGACIRIHPTEYFSEVNQIQGLAFAKRNGTNIYGRGLMKKDRGKQIVHLFGILLMVLMCGMTALGIARFGLGRPLLNTTWFNLRWITGIVGLLGIIFVMLYPIRRQIFKRRAGALRYWMMAHAYVGGISGILLLLHGGTSLGGPLTAALMLSFDLVILTGLFGILIYWIGPRMLTQIEGEPLLIEDLTERRYELYQEIADLIETAQTLEIKEIIRNRVVPRFLSLGYLLRQYLIREDLSMLMAAGRAEFKDELSRLDGYDRAVLEKAIEAATTLRRVDALIYIHRALKVWLPPHVVTTSVMLALMLVHIFQVIYYAWF